MPLSESLGHWIQHLDFSVVLPLLGRMPLAMGENLSKLRGLFAAVADYEWRSLALRQRYIRNRTYLAMKALRPQANHRQWMAATAARFIHNSREEWQACLFNRDIMQTIAQRSIVEGIDPLLENYGKGRGLVLVSCHFDSFCMGMVILGMHGLPVNVINTAMIEDPRIHPAVRAFFKRKYQAMEHRMHGRMAYYQTEMPYFLRALRRGEVVTLMGDVPGSKSDVIIRFLGQKFRMPLGAWKLAKETGSLLAGYVCLHIGPGKYRVVCLPPREIDPQSPEKTMAPVYHFLEGWIKKAPQRWISADLLPGYSSQ